MRTCLYALFSGAAMQRAFVAPRKLTTHSKVFANAVLTTCSRTEGGRVSITEHEQWGAPAAAACPQTPTCPG